MCSSDLLRALALPDCYGITQAAAVGVEAFLQHLDAALTRGLKLIQVREKAMAAGELHQFAAQVVDRARPYGARVLINGDAQLARAIGADGVHLTSAQLLALNERPACEWVAASCHNREEITAATRLGADFVVVGPVAPTPTHPGAAVLGWGGFAQCIADTTLPVYALGGMQVADLSKARQQGAHGIAMLRGAWV